MEGDDAGTLDTPVDGDADFDRDTSLQIHEAVESLQQVETIEPSVWASLDADARLEVLQNVEERMAAIQGRPTVEVTSMPMGQNTFGGYDGARISLNADHLASDMPVEEFVNTIVHEGRHAYQDYAVHHPGFVTNQAVVDSWAENMVPGNYLTAEEYGQALYASQPIEADAWAYADRITRGLSARGAQGQASWT